MDVDESLKYWRDAGHVARRTLEAMKLELQPGKTFHEIIESAERFIHRHGGKPAEAREPRSAHSHPDLPCGAGKCNVIPDQKWR